MLAQMLAASCDASLPIAARAWPLPPARLPLAGAVGLAAARARGSGSCTLGAWAAIFFAQSPLACAPLSPCGAAGCPAGAGALGGVPVHGSAALPVRAG